MVSVEKRFLKWPIQIPRMEYEINNHFRLKHFTSEDGAITFHPDNGIRLQNYRVIDLRIPQIFCKHFTTTKLAHLTGLLQCIITK